MQDFFDVLEYSISRTLAGSANSDKRRCWCDGIMLPEIGESYVVQRHCSADKSKRRDWVEARAWIEEGKTKLHGAEQKIYKLIVILGEKSQKCHLNTSKLMSCIPPENQDDWIGLDMLKKVVTVALL